ncbi:HpcH/HpaI aldolase family protein [Paenibacillus koleovorans]|uniref:HpcH/HpaI aldolase family protein n=1 Tax=Paenibacillus koleovorans TaxID=121608 RepID=UPI000FDB238E|nr:aldolase/citrate lyase family protein [Paenibacillus koleovorans]
MERKPFDLQPSRVLQKLKAGGVAYATKLNLADPRVVEIACMVSGVDCIWLDMEHVANDWSMIEKQILAAKAYDVDVMVRVARGSYSELVKPLELDATCILVPHVMSADDARQVAHFSKFHPIGRRPMDGGNADGRYANLALPEYMRQANEQRFNVLQIEDPEPLEELETIIALPGVDGVFFGPGDFSQGIGAPGEWDHPLITETRKRIADLAVKHGKIAATIGSLGNVEELVAMGYRFISLGADVIGLSEYYNHLFNELSGKQERLNMSLYGEKA